MHPVNVRVAGCERALKETSMSDHKQSYVAHACHLKNAPGIRVQSLEEHLRAIAALSETFAAKAGLPRAGLLVGMLHDFGKYSKEFQSYILSAAGCIEPGEPEYTDPEANKGKINHAFAGGQHIWRRLNGNAYKRAVAQMMALCVLSHHSCLRDCITPDREKAFVDDYMERHEEKIHHNECERACDPLLTAELDHALHADLLLLAEPSGNLVQHLLQRRPPGRCLALKAATRRPDHGVHQEL